MSPWWPTIFLSWQTTASRKVTGGTSAAVQLWAAFNALVNQQAAASGQRPVGFINPAIYALGKSANYSAVLQRRHGGQQQHEWGAPPSFSPFPATTFAPAGVPRLAAALILALATPDRFVITPGRGFAANGPVGGPFIVTALSLSLTNSGTSSLNWSLSNTSLWLNVSPAGGTLTPGGASATVTVSLNAAANSLAAGVYTANLRLTNTTSGLVQTRQFTLQVSQELVQDGGFEAGDFAYWNLAGSDAGSYNYVDDGSSTGLTPYSGTYFAALGEYRFPRLPFPDPADASGAALLALLLAPERGPRLRHDSQPIPGKVERLHPDQHCQCRCVRLDKHALCRGGHRSEHGSGVWLAQRPGVFALDDVSVEPLPVISSLVLVVQTNGNGKVTPNYNGKPLVIGTTYTLKATPANNCLFSNWVGGTTLPYTVLSTSNVYTFTMQSNLVMQANFVPNPFIPEQGTFNGLFWNPTNVTEASSGFFTLTLRPSGAFTGKIMTSGGTYNFPTTRNFDVGGQVQFTVPTKQSSLTFNLQLDLSHPASQQITGTVTDGTWTAALTADRASFNAKTNPAVNYGGPPTPWP